MATNDPSSPWYLLLLAGLLGINAFFVAAEYALVSVRKTRLDELIERGVKSAEYARQVVGDLDRYIATTQLCITMAGIGLGWVGEPALTALLMRLLGLPLQALDEGLRRAISVAVAFALVTFATVVIGELVPKSVTLKYPEQVALAVSRVVIFFSRLFRPIIWALEGAAGLALRLLGLRAEPARGSAYSVQELKLIVEASQAGGVLEDEERDMLHAVFDFGLVLARQVMVPRTEMTAIAADAAVDELIRLMAAHPYTKFPVYEGDLDHILGVVHTKDLVRVQHSERRTATVRGLMRETLFVPETIRVGALLRQFRANRQHIAIVLDEYGGTAGLVTLGDLIAEIIGEVGDPFDRSAPAIQRLPDGSALIEGATPIETVNEHFGLDLKDPNYDTIAGFVLGRLERIARVGDEVQAGGVRLKVEALDGLRIARVSMHVLPVPQPAAAKAARP